jgi:NADH dehydrogenase
VAGMLAELKKYVLAKDYPELRDTPGAIYIIDGSPTLLTPMSEKTHKNSFDALTGLNVIIKLNTRVLDFDGSSIILSGGEIIEAKSLIWAAGVIAVVPEGIPATSVGHGRRMMVDGHNKVIGIEDIYAIGDVCIQQSDKDFPKGHPQLAQVAIQQGQNLAHNFLAMAKGKPLKTFKYFDKGTMAIVGRNYAVVDLAKPKFHIKGFPALFIWLFIHVMSLLNHRNKAITLYNWAVAYITKDQSLRMIFRG